MVECLTADQNRVFPGVGYPAQLKSSIYLKCILLFECLTVEQNLTVAGYPAQLKSRIYLEFILLVESLTADQRGVLRVPDIRRN